MGGQLGSGDTQINSALMSILKTPEYVANTILPPEIPIFIGSESNSLLHIESAGVILLVLSTDNLRLSLLGPSLIPFSRGSDAIHDVRNSLSRQTPIHLESTTTPSTAGAGNGMVPDSPIMDPSGPRMQTSPWVPEIT